MRKIRKIRLGTIMIFFIFNVVFAIVLAPFIIFWGPYEASKTLVVGSVLTSRHPQVVKAFLSDEQISAIVNKYNNSTNSTVLQRTVADASAGITIEDIKGQGYNGKVMLIKDPKRIKVAVTKNLEVT